MSEQLYYDVKDIQTILKVGKHKANEIMHMFEERGELFRSGRTMRIRKTYFNNWLDKMDGKEARRTSLSRNFSE